MTIHSSHPFPTDDEPVRRFRGRLGAAVTLWTAVAPRGPVGLTVTSVLVAPGEPDRLLVLIDPDSELGEHLDVGSTAVCQVLSWADRDLADAFAGEPAPGGPFRLREWEETAWGPALPSAAWAGVRVESVREMGWSVELTCLVEEVGVPADDEALLHRRGRYIRLPASD